jgi:hypothetical protein
MKKMEVGLTYGRTGREGRYAASEEGEALWWRLGKPEKARSEEVSRRGRATGRQC